MPRSFVPTVLCAAVRDWRSGRAYHGNDGHFYLFAWTVVCGVARLDRGGRARRAPWSDAARNYFGGSDRLHEQGRRAYPPVTQTDFENMHGMDRVAGDLLREIAREEGLPT